MKKALKSFGRWLLDWLRNYYPFLIGLAVLAFVVWFFFPSVPYTEDEYYELTQYQLIKQIEAFDVLSSRVKFLLALVVGVGFLVFAIKDHEMSSIKDSLGSAEHKNDELRDLNRRIIEDRDKIEQDLRERITEQEQTIRELKQHQKR